MVTTDNQYELFDVVDESDNVIGTATRREVHANKKLIHRSIGVLVFNAKGDLLLQQRSGTKDTDPLKWTISCSGHVSSNNPITQSTNNPINEKTKNLSLYEKTAHRELIEELGIDVPIEFVTKFLCRAPHETEMQALFKAVIGPKTRSDLVFNREEIIQGKFFTQNGLRSAIQEGNIILSFMGKVALGKTGWL